MSRKKLAAIIVVCTIAIIAAIVIPKLIDRTGTSFDLDNRNIRIHARSCYEARDHIGQRTIVSGTVVGTNYASGSSGQPTSLNMCYDYPNPNRFTVVIWGRDRDKFPPSPEDYYLGKTIYVWGLIQLYEGVPGIEVTSPSQILEEGILRRYGLYIRP